jgi:hypothetical protein
MDLNQFVRLEFPATLAEEPPVSRAGLIQIQAFPFSTRGGPQAQESRGNDASVIERQAIPGLELIGKIADDSVSNRSGRPIDD